MHYVALLVFVCFYIPGSTLYNNITSFSTLSLFTSSTLCIIQIIVGICCCLHEYFKVN